MLGHLLEAEQVGRPRALDAALTDDAVVDQLDAVSFVCMEQAALRNLAQRLLLRKERNRRREVGSEGGGGGGLGVWRYGR
jgi:hypothetical protein